jgi:hypothetical protein
MMENNKNMEPDQELNTADLDQVSGGAIGKNYKFTLELKLRLYCYTRDQKKHHGYSLPQTIGRAKIYFQGEIKWADIEDFVPIYWDIYMTNDEARSRLLRDAFMGVS